MRRLQPSTQVVVVQLLGNCKVGSRVEPLCIVVAGVHLEKHTRRSSHTLCTPDVCPSSVYYVPQQRGTCTRMVTTQGLSASCFSAAAAQVMHAGTATHSDAPMPFPRWNGATANNMMHTCNGALSFALTWHTTTPTAVGERLQQGP